MTPRDPTPAERRMMRAIVRWFRAQGGAPRHRAVEAEQALAALAEEILAGTEVDMLG